MLVNTKLSKLSQLTTLYIIPIGQNEMGIHSGWYAIIFADWNAVHFLRVVITIMTCWSVHSNRIHERCTLTSHSNAAHELWPILTPQTSPQFHRINPKVWGAKLYRGFEESRKVYRFLLYIKVPSTFRHWNWRGWNMSVSIPPTFDLLLLDTFLICYFIAVMDSQQCCSHL